MARLLIVDDDEATARLLELVLVKTGYAVVRAHSGEQALEMLVKHQIDLVVLDMMMPGVSGVEVCRAMRADPVAAHIPILILSAVSDVERKGDAFEAGADDYVTKPVHTEELKLRIRTLLARRSAAATAPQPSRPRGQVIALVGTGGGVGVSQTAINLAASVLDECPDTVIAEFVPGTGKLAQQLQATPKATLAELAQLPESGLTPDVIQRAITRHASGLDLLTSDQDERLALEPELLRPSTVETITRYLAEHYRLVLLNLGHGLSARVRAGCALASQVVLVTRIEPLPLKVAAQQFKLLNESGIPANKLHLVLAVFHEAVYTLKPEQVQNILKVLDEGGVRKHILMTIPPSADLILEAQQRGVPPVLIDPQGKKLHSLFRKAMKKLQAA
jgi:CheY-like chemotaxis protein